MNTKNNTCIFNYWWTENYGAILTAYVLQNVVNSFNEKKAITQYIEEKYYKELMNKYNHLSKEENKYA